MVANVSLEKVHVYKSARSGPRLWVHCTTIESIFHAYLAMSLTAGIVYLPIFWYCVTALPAGPGFWPNGTSSPTAEFSALEAFSLIDTYDGSNWLNKFDVQAVSTCASRPLANTDFV